MEKRQQVNKLEDSQTLAESVTEICRRPSINRLIKLLSLLSGDNWELLDHDPVAKQKVLYNVLQLPEKHRDANLVAIIGRLLADMDFVGKMRQSYSQIAVDELCKELRSSFEPAGRHLIKIGEESDRLYFIIKGEVLVLYPRSAADVDRQSIGKEEFRGTSRTHQILAEYEHKSPFKGLSVKTVENFQNLFNPFTVPLYQVEASLRKGQSFGELGIIYEQRRMAHIICRTDCQFGTLTAEQYLHIISNKWQAGRIHSKLLFLEKHFYSRLRELDLREAQRFVYLFSPLEFKVNSQIVSLHSPIKGAYILVEGSIVIKRQSTSLENYATEVSELNFLMRASQHRSKNLHEVRKLVTGDCFGLTELVTNNGTCDRIFFQYEAIAASNCKLLYCPDNKLLKVLSEDNKLEVELRARAKDELLLLKEATFGIIKSSSKEKELNPSRYYLSSPDDSRQKTADRVLRSIPRQMSGWKCDHTLQPSKYSVKRPASTHSRQNEDSFKKVMATPPTRMSRLRRNKTTSAAKADSNIGLMRMSTTNIKRILSDPFSYY